MSFVHLHVHTQYSLLDGMLQAKDLAKKVKELEMPAVAMTDHGNVFGAVEFYLAMKDVGVKPIIGCEVYCAPGSRFDKTQRTQRDAVTFHLVLLAQNRQGYRNLCRLVTAGFFEGFYYKPRIDFDLLQKWNSGLIALSGCPRGLVPSLLRKGKKDEAKEEAMRLAEVFDGRFYIEIERGVSRDLDRINPDLVALAHDLHLPLVATNDCHYLAPEDAEAHDVLLCIQTARTVDEENRMKMDSHSHDLKSPAQMHALFADLPEACENTLRIADSIDPDFFEMGKYHFPRFEPAPGKTLEDSLREDSRLGLGERLKLICRQADPEKEKIYTERLERELETITKMGFAGYFLIVADFVKFARDHDIPVGPGRGSAAGSLVAYSLGITDIDPIPYDLLFERFLNPERISMPDIDMDFCIRGRDEVIRYVRKKYGPLQEAGENAGGLLDQVAQIITFGKMQAKAVLRDVGRALNMPYADCDRISKMVPNVLNISLEEALEQEPKLKALVSEEAQVTRLMELALRLEGLVRHASIHAAGVVMSDGPLVDFMPLYRGADGEVVTQFDMVAAEKLGLIKFDFLGLKTLTVIEDACKMIKEKKPDFDLRFISFDDAQVYRTLSLGKTLGIFQLESGGMRDLIMKLKPSSFEDMIALVALYRPGPLGSGMVDDFIQRKHGRAAVTYPLPQLEPILKNTYGIILYQEQVMQISSVLANYSLGEADLLRRAMGKKKPEEMAKQKDRFMQGARQNKIPDRDSDPIFELMAKFAEYGFNKSHSAAYALIAYQTAFLKAHHAHDFMASLLNSEIEDTDKIFTYMHECRASGIEILPPDVNESQRNFNVTPEMKIRFGLSALKNVGSAAVDAVLEARQKGPFRNFMDFVSRVDLRRVNKRVVESLIQCGAFDFSKEKRETLFANIQSVLELGQKIQEEAHTGQTNIFALKGSKAPADIALKPAEPWDELTRLYNEKKALGFFITGHPLTFYQDVFQRHANATSQKLMGFSDRAEVRLAGVVNHYKKRVNRKGLPFANVTFEDLDGLFEVVLFSKVFEKFGGVLDRQEPFFVKGYIDASEESPKIIGQEIIPMTEVARIFASRVELRMAESVLEKKDLSLLKDIMAKGRGKYPVYIRLRKNHGDSCEALISLKDFSIDPSQEMIAEINHYFGENVVHLV